ncbi:MAG TPA: hypothetical protein VER14_09270 [Phototrophicaceae bacterium]|nr:hypothetical protein [Phototrophicaceae bacterium]
MDRDSFESKDQNLCLIDGSIISASLPFRPPQIMSVEAAMIDNPYP